MTRNETEQRTPVWIALSELYLDTALDTHDFERIAKVICNSCLTLDEVKSIDYYEMAPLLGENLLNPAGVWSGFDSDWLVANCTENYKQREDIKFKIKCYVLNLRCRSFRKENWRCLAKTMKKASAT